MVLNIDYGLCQGCGGCTDAFPQYFELRDDKAWVIHAELFNDADREGIMTVCPYYAISLE
jgi:ferredoxin